MVYLANPNRDHTPLPARDALAHRFAVFADHECAGSSPLYERLARAVASDSALLDLAAQAASGPIPNLFLGAVHFLLLRRPDDPLAAYYPSLSPLGRLTSGDSVPAFRAFCLAQRHALVALLRTRRVQTNEVRRAASLLPAFGLVASMEPSRPLAVIEIGASAGLLLLWDRYQFAYGPGLATGEGTSPVRLACELRGDHRPPIPGPLPRVGWRLGIDLHPIDVWDDEEPLWLRALIWPEHTDRAELLARALRLVRAAHVPLLQGDALAELPSAVAMAPPDMLLCILHSHTLNQFPPEAQQAFDDLLGRVAQRRPLWRIGQEYRPGTRHATIALEHLSGGKRQHRTLARCDSHGNWLEWLG